MYTAFIVGLLGGLLGCAVGLSLYGLIWWLFENL